MDTPPPTPDKPDTPLTIRLFAGAAEAAGVDRVTIPPADRAALATVADIKRRLLTDYPPLIKFENHLLAAIGTAYARDDDPVTEATEVSFFPPVSGG